MSSNNETLARTFFIELLAGHLNGKSPDFAVFPGDYIEPAKALHAVWIETDDLSAVRQVWGVLVKQSPKLGKLVSSDPISQQKVWTAAELISAEFPELKWTVQDLIPIGLSSLGGRPKVGKSWMALQISHAVGTGGRLFDQEVDQGKVLYLALEDSPRRLQNRLNKQLVPEDADITFMIEWSKMLDNDGLAELGSTLHDGGYKLLIIDTISRLLGSADQQDMAVMTQQMGGLQRLALDSEISILLIDHHRKPGVAYVDPIDDLIGSTAKAAALDAALALVKERGKQGFTLAITGRDLEERKLALEWHRLTCTWQYLGDADEVRKDSVQGLIMDAIRTTVDLGALPTNKRISEYIKRDPANVSHGLADLLNARLIFKGKKTGKEQPYYIHGEHEQHHME